MFQWRLKAEISIKQFYNNDQLNGVLGIWTLGRSMVGADETAELWPLVLRSASFCTFKTVEPFAMSLTSAVW